MAKNMRGRKQTPKTKAPQKLASELSSKEGAFGHVGIGAYDVNESDNLFRAFFDSPGVMRGIVELVDDTTVWHIVDNQVTASVEVGQMPNLFGIDTVNLEQ